LVSVRARSKFRFRRLRQKDASQENSVLEQMKKVLWISGRLPTPLFSGDALYSAGLLKALSMTNEVALSVVGTRRSHQPITDHGLGLPNTICIDAPPFRTSGLLSLLSPLPRDAYNLGTPEVEQALERLLKEPWDWIVIDHAYSSGLLSLILRGRRDASICYVAHNAEGKIRPQIASNFDNSLRKVVMRLDAEKYRRLENRILREADAIICITDTDASYFRSLAAHVHVVPPIYLGQTSAPRIIDANCPRSLLLLGSFDWIAKQKNLELIVDALLPVLKLHWITLNVVGTVPQTIVDQYVHHRPNLIFHGRVADISTYLLSSRGGLVPDLLGGGFKLKVMDYAFERLPIFGLKEALAGTTPDEQSAMFLADSLDDLAATIVRNIDNLDALNRNQETLFKLFSDRFGLVAGVQRLREVFLQPADTALDARQ
jgi:glycosyltransferase involved in cell wall biosynthesis